MTQRTNSHKNNANLLSNQVKDILQSRGLSAIFNYSDYLYFKTKARTAFNKAQAIAEQFIDENTTTKSDFSQYQF